MASQPPTPGSPNKLIRIVYLLHEEGDVVPTDPISVDLRSSLFGLIPSIIINKPPAQIACLLNNLLAQGFVLYRDFLPHGIHYQSILLGLSSQRSTPANIGAFCNTLSSFEVGIYQATGTPSLSEITAGLNSIPQELYGYVTSRSFGYISPVTYASLPAARALPLRYFTSDSYFGLESPEFTSSDSPYQQPAMGLGRAASSSLPHTVQDQPLLYNPALDLESEGGFFSPYNIFPGLLSGEGVFAPHNMPPDHQSGVGFFPPYNMFRHIRSGEGFFSRNISSNLGAGGSFFPSLLHPRSGGASSEPNGIDIEIGSGGNGGGQQPQNPSMMTETFMVVTAEVGLALLTVMSGSKNTLSTNEKILLYSAGVCNVGGFLCCLGATLKPAGIPGGQFATKTMAAIAKVATSYGFLSVMGTLLPDELMLRVTIPGAVVLLIPLSYAFIKN